jgi:hypothetical protein
MRYELFDEEWTAIKSTEAGSQRGCAFCNIQLDSRFRGMSGVGGEIS